MDGTGSIGMSIEIDILNGDASWPRVKSLFALVWTPDVMGPLADVTWAHPDLRVILDADDGTTVCHVGLYFRDGIWNGRKVRLGGVGGVSTHPAYRGKGYASVALNAAIATFRHHEATDFIVLVCGDHNIAFYADRGWHAFNGKLLVEQQGERVEFDVQTPMVFDLALRPREGVIDLCGLPW